MKKPKPTAGLRHVALFAKNFEACEQFYTNILGMAIVWRPDADNLYLCANADNFALHRAPADFTESGKQRLDHIGFFLTTPEEVDEWHDYLRHHHVTIKAAPKNHRDGTRSLYCADPDGNVIQLIYMPEALLR